MTIGSPFPIDGGVGTRTLWRRVSYGGKKGRRAQLRLRALERRIARSGFVQASLARTIQDATDRLEGVLRMARIRLPAVPLRSTR